MENAAVHLKLKQGLEGTVAYIAKQWKEHVMCKFITTFSPWQTRFFNSKMHLYGLHKGIFEVCLEASEFQLYSQPTPRIFQSSKYVLVCCCILLTHKRVDHSDPLILIPHIYLQRGFRAIQVPLKCHQWCESNSWGLANDQECYNNAV